MRCGRKTSYHLVNRAHDVYMTTLRETQLFDGDILPITHVPSLARSGRDIMAAIL